MASDFETVIAKCDGCKHEEECREMPPCIMDAYNKGRADAIEECTNDLIEKHEYCINRGENDYAFGVRLCIEDLFQLKEQNNDT